MEQTPTQNRLDLRSLQVANVMIDTGNHELARKICFELLPNFPCGEVYLTLGRATHDPHEAIEWYKKGLEKSPFCAGIHWELGCRYLLLGEYQKAFEKMECRWDSFEQLKRVYQQYLIAKTWYGKRGVRLNVVSSEGIGDCFFYARWLQFLNDCEVTLCCDDSLHSLMTGQIGIKKCINATWEDYDYHTMLLSLPYRLGINPPTRPYIKVNPLPRRSSKFTIALCHCGNPEYAGDFRRSMPLEMFRPLTEIADIDVISLVKVHKPRAYSFDARPRNLSAGMDTMKIHQPELPDWKATAEVMTQCDVIVSCDSGVLNLAGAMGLPAIGLLMFGHDARWGNGEYSALNPSVRLIRQPKFGDWDSVIETLMPMIYKLVAAHKEQ